MGSECCGASDKGKHPSWELSVSRLKVSSEIYDRRPSSPRPFKEAGAFNVFELLWLIVARQCCQIPALQEMRTKDRIEIWVIVRGGGGGGGGGRAFSCLWELTNQSGRVLKETGTKTHPQTDGWVEELQQWTEQENRNVFWTLKLVNLEMSEYNISKYIYIVEVLE